MIRYPMFYRKNMIWRASQFGEVRELSDLEELPVGSVLHVLDNFQQVDPPVFYPRDDNPIIGLNDYLKFVHHVTTPVTNGPEPLIPVNSKGMIFPLSGLMPALNVYRRAHMPKIRICSTMTEFPERPSTLPIVSYNSLYRARVTGMRQRMRFMSFLLTMILNKIAEAPNKDHFIHIPMTALRFSKQDFMRVFKESNRTSVIYPELPQYIFLSHFYSIIVDAKISLDPASEEQMDEPGMESWTDGVTDKITTEDMLTGLRSYSVNGEPDAGTEAWEVWQNYNSSVFELLPVKYWEKVNFIFTAGDKYISYNLKTLKQLNGRNNVILLRLINQINSLSDHGAVGAVVAEEPVIASERIIKVDTRKEINAPVAEEPLSIQEKEEFAKEDIVQMEKAAEEIAEKTPELTPAQIDRAKRISKSYKEVTIGGEKVDKLLTEPTVVTVEDNELPFIEPEVPMPDLTGSSIETLDKVYTQRVMKKDIASIATSFAPLGMYLTDAKEEVVADDINRLRKYTFKFEDVRHKNHTIRFTIPELSDDGRCLINGTIKSLSKQRVSNPICKVSPTRVTLNSDFNKALVERNTNVAHNLLDYFDKYLKKIGVQGVYGDNVYPLKSLPSDYTQLGGKYASVTLSPEVKSMEALGDQNNEAETKLFFNYDKRSDEIPSKYHAFLSELESKYGVLCGSTPSLKIAHFIDIEGMFTSVNLESKQETFVGTLIDKLESITGVSPGPLNEWVDLKLLNKNIPVIFALAYRYGLSAMLKYCNVDFYTEEFGSRSEAKTSDVVVRFADKRLVINRTPQVNSLLFAGLNYYDLKSYNLEDMDDKNVYYDLLMTKGMTMNNIKGIDDFFDLFIDPKTRDILRDMRKPTNVRDLLIVATTMLTTREHLPSASSVNYRFRGTEQITAIVYNELARSFATYRNRSKGAKSTWSISEYLIKQKIITQQLMENVTVLNPIDDIKQYTKFSHAGVGGRQGESFKIADRQYTADSMGTISEATVDNSKVGMNAIAPIDPIITNAYGMSTPVDPKDLKPSNVLSITSVLMPCVTQDDSKRKFVRIQLVIVV